MRLIRAVLLTLAGATLATHLALSRETWFSNQGGIVNTRHNLTQRPAMGGAAVLMDNYRNDYGEVCVYCHTPHGANANVAAPLWNRNIKNTAYTTYDQGSSPTLTGAVYQPGAASLTCLSCHDGQQAVDAIINMPGPGRYNPTPDDAFLSSWVNPSGYSGTHLALSSNIAWGPSGSPGVNFPTSMSCLTCHSPSVAGNTLSGIGQDFTIAAIGLDLRSTHPVGVPFPTANGTGTDWKTPGGSAARGSLVSKFFDENADGRMDKDEIRLYDSGNGASVECASCHDPHGVPSAGSSSVIFPTFLRKVNTGSAVCLTCHSK